jgi:hypothetical protein
MVGALLFVMWMRFKRPIVRYLYGPRRLALIAATISVQSHLFSVYATEVVWRLQHSAASKQLPHIRRSLLGRLDGN